MDEYKNFVWKIHNTHKETIICPSCSSIEIAEVIEKLPFGIYVHNCTKCKYTIMENEWKRVKPKCKKCGHEICPHCGDWCDVVLYSKNDIGNHEDVEDNDDYPALCCGGKCEIE